MCDTNYRFAYVGALLVPLFAYVAYMVVKVTKLLSLNLTDLNRPENQILCNQIKKVIFQMEERVTKINKNVSVFEGGASLFDPPPTSYS